MAKFANSGQQPNNQPFYTTFDDWINQGLRRIIKAVQLTVNQHKQETEHTYASQSTPPL